MESNPPCKKQKFVDGKIQKKSYDSIHKFQTKWVVKMPWIEGLVAKDGFINMVKLKCVILIENKEKITGCKWDI